MIKLSGLEEDQVRRYRVYLDPEEGQDPKEFDYANTEREGEYIMTYEFGFDNDGSEIKPVTIGEMAIGMSGPMFNPEAPIQPNEEDNAESESSEDEGDVASEHHPGVFSSNGKPILCLTHGFGGSGLIFYKIMKELALHFHVYMFDLPGMGRSSRDEFLAENFDDAEEYYLPKVDKWRTHLGFEKMILAGHSFGGYIVGLYAMKHPEIIERLVLLSPVGGPAKPEEFNME